MKKSKHYIKDEPVAFHASELTGGLPEAKGKEN
jgi:hypothetical protein